jgi:hypothetical protein
MFIELDTEHGNTIINVDSTNTQLTATADHIIEIYMGDPEYNNYGFLIDKINIKLTNGKVYTQVFKNKDVNICFEQSMGFFDVLRKMLKTLRKEDFL